MELELLPSCTVSSDELALFARRVAVLRDAAGVLNPAQVAAQFMELHLDLERFVGELQRSLVVSSLDWTDEDRAVCRWIHDMNSRVAQIGRSAMERARTEDEQAAFLLCAFTFYYTGECEKWDVALRAHHAHDFAALHALMRWAISIGRALDHTPLALHGRSISCTLEGLYFRALLLARFSAGNLNVKQIEILDAWILTWLPVVAAVGEAPPGSALRVDLDSSAGLQRGPRQGPGPSLYLPQEPIERAYRSIVRAFHEGRMLPTRGLSSELRVEEHVAVLDLVRKGLDESKEVPRPRAARREVSVIVEIFIGIAEIEREARNPSAHLPGAMALRSVKAITQSGTHGRERHIEEIYDQQRRVAQMLDRSERGMRLEDLADSCAGAVPGDVIGVKMDGALHLGSAARVTPSSTGDGLTLGVSLFGLAPRLVRVVPAGGGSGEGVVLMFVGGDDASGRHDGFLVGERFFSEDKVLDVALGPERFSLRLNRVRDRGRGWILAGFEIVESEQAARKPPQAASPGGIASPS